MLRAVRLGAKLGLSIDPDARQPIREMATLIENVPPARLFDEMLKLLFSGHAVTCLKQLREEGLHHGLLPLLDVILEQPQGERFVWLSLDNTDQRVRQASRCRPDSSSRPCFGTRSSRPGKSARPRASRSIQPCLRQWTRSSSNRRASSPSHDASRATSGYLGPPAAFRQARREGSYRVIEQPAIARDGIF